PGLATLAEQVRVDVDRDGLAIEVVDPGKALLFDVSSAELKPGVVALLERMGPILGQLPNAVSVAGHTDPRPFPAGSAKTNWQLAFDRADAARRVLERAGLRPGQLERVISCADSDPLVPSTPLADENRRLTILARRRTPPVAPEGPVTDELRGAP